MGLLPLIWLLLKTKNHIVVRVKPIKENPESKNSFSLEQYEKFGNRAYSLDQIGGYFFTAAILIILSLGLYLSLIGINKSNSQDQYFSENVIPILVQIFVYSLTATLVCSLLFQWIGIAYIHTKKYNKNEIIQKYLDELKENQNPARKYEILKHLFFNLIRLRETEGKKDFVLLHNYRWKEIHKVGRRTLKFEIRIINKTIYFLEDAIIFLNLEDYRQILTDLSQLIYLKDYRGIADLLIKNEASFEKIEKMKKEVKMQGIKGNLRKIKIAFEWTSLHGRNWVAIIILIVLLILFLLGKIQTIPNP